MHGPGVFRDPTSVAVVGASDNRSKWGYRLAAGALAGAHRRRVHLGSRRGGAVCGQRCAPGPAALDEVPDLVALCVPAHHVSDVVAEGISVGVRGFLGITAGVPAEPELAQRIRAGGARLVGELELNPVRVGPDGAVAVDALVIPAARQEAHRA